MEDNYLNCYGYLQCKGNYNKRNCYPSKLLFYGRYIVLKKFFDNAVDVKEVVVYGDDYSKTILKLFHLY